MNKSEYKKLVETFSPKENKLKNIGITFLVGGLLGFFGEVITEVLQLSLNMSKTDSYIWLSVIVIFFSSLFTAMGFFDEWVSDAKAGLMVPISGFAHSVTSSALDYKKDGLITGLGANFFKLAGSVILYSMISAFFLALLRVIISG